jgi:hypothetical protein
VLLVGAVLALAAAHATLLRQLAARVALPLAAVLVIIALVAIGHAGLLRRVKRRS